jgi:hypothetical protein
VTGTSRPGDVPQGWVSDTDFKAQLHALGCTVPQQRIAKWREVDLVPSPYQAATYKAGKVFGSEVWHPPKAALHVLATQRVLAEKSRLDFAGTVLWMAGAEVPESYWRPRLIKADALLRGIHRRMRVLVREPDNADDTLGDRAVGALDRLTGVLAKIERRTPDGQLPLVFNVGSQIVAGDFKRLATQPHDEGDLSELELVEQVMDLKAARADSIHGAKFNFIGGLSQALGELSTSIGRYSLNDFSDDEIKAARDDVRNGFKLAVCHYEATKWIYGDEAFGLRTASFMATTVSTDVFFLWVVLFARLRRHADHFHTTAEIAAMAHTAELTWLAATYFRDLQSNPNLAKSIDSKRLKLAFEDSHELKNLIEELVGCEFPMPEFRPWDQWKKLSRKTMSPGLLAMSIGAPNQVSLDAIQRDASGVPNP